MCLQSFVARLFLAGAVFILPSGLAAQTPNGVEGIPPHTVELAVPTGFVNPMNGHVHLEIPIASIPERNGDPLVAKMVFDTNRYVYARFGSASWSSTGSGWRLMLGTSHSGSAGSSSSSSSCNDPG